MKSEILVINDKEYIKYDINQNQIEELEYKMSKKNNIIGFLDFDKRYFDGNCSLIYTMDNCISLEKYYKKRTIQEKELIEIFIQITELILSLKNFFLLRKDNIDIKVNRVFYDYKNKKVKLIYIPINSKKSINEKTIDFINDFLSIMIVEDLHSKFVNELKKYISNSFFSISGLRTFLKDQQIKLDNLYIKKEKKENIIVEKEEKSEVGLDFHLENNLRDRSLKIKLNNKKKTNKKEVENLEKEDLLTNLIRVLCIEIIGILIINIIFKFTNITNGLLKTIIILLVQGIILIPMYLLVLNQYINLFNNEKNESVINKDKMKKDIKKEKSNSLEINSNETCFEIDKGSKTQFNVSELTYTTKGYLESKGNRIEEKIFIDKKNFIIGRKKENTDYYIPNKKISKLHVEFLDIEDELFIKDLNSTNGTFVNGVRIESEKLINIYDEDYIKMGNEEYIFRIN